MSFRDAFNNATPEQIRAAQMIAEARAERDDARAEAERLKVENEVLRASPDLHLSWLCKAMAAMGHGADQARWPKGMYVIEALLRERDKLKAECDALKDAAKVLLTDALDECDAYGCQTVATRRLGGGDDAGVYCDACAEDLQAPCGGAEEIDFEDLSWAPAIRTLRTLLEGKS